MDFKVGDSVRFRPAFAQGRIPDRTGQVGVVMQIFDNLPGVATAIVDIRFGEEDVQRNVSARLIEHAQPAR